MKSMPKKLAACSLVLLLMLYIPVYAANYDCAAGKHKDIIVSQVNPTDTQDGYIRYRCELCGREYETTLYASGHIWSAWITDKEPTCTETGERHRTCNEGVPHSEVEKIPALGHDYKLTVKEAICEEAGLHTYTCSRCGDSYTEPGAAALGHIYGETITQEATCTENGIKTFTCIHNAEESYIESIPAIGHDFGAWTVEIPPEANIPGKEVRVCSHCNEIEERAVAALPAIRTIQTPDENPPLFNIIDLVAFGLDIGIIVLFLLLILPCIKTVSKERKDYRENMRRRAAAEAEDKQYDFR